MPIDPICGMEVHESTASSVEHDGTTIYFCGENCRQKFLGQQPQDERRPADAAGAEGGACCHLDHEVQSVGRTLTGTTKKAKYVCPMCVGSESDQPGDCPKCGMALEPNRSLAKSYTVYTCPMHPEVEQDGPGTCPKCGMELEPKYVAAGGEKEDSELRMMTRRCPLDIVARWLPLAGRTCDFWAVT